MKQSKECILVFSVVFLGSYLGLCFLIPELRIKLATEPMEYFVQSLRHMVWMKLGISAIVAFVASMVYHVLGSKKGISLTLVLCICMSLTACGGGKDLSLGDSTTDLTKNRNTDTIYCWDDTVIAGEDYDAEKVNLALTDFAVRLFQKNIEMEQISGQDSRNVFISPTSVISALGMTSFGAKGDTLAQIEDTFGVSRGHINSFYSENIQNLSKELKIANSIWFTSDEKMTVKEDFLQFNEEVYGTDIYQAAFDQQTLKDINAWVENKTDGAIKEILDEIPPDAVMYLINALVFEAEWEEKYDETQMREGKFTTVEGEKQQVDMMYSKEQLYLEDENATGVVKYYKDKNYAFVALLPNENTNVYDYAQTLTGEHLSKLLSKPTEVMVHTWIPQFTMEYDVEMSDLLVEMGMKDAFDGARADFTGLATHADGNIKIDRVLHKTYIEVTPAGTKAGAATVVEMQVESAADEPDDIKEVRLDRPFIYMIIDCENNQPIFIGVVNSIE